MEITAWQFVGLALIIWVMYDLIMGYTYLHRKIIRKYEPLFYWTILAIWLVIATYTLGLV